MARYFCHDHPDVLTLETWVVDARPGAVALERTPFYPGGGGQLPDRGADNDRLRALEAEVNDAIRQDLPLRIDYVPHDVAMAQAGLIRSRSVAPPPDEQGLVRIVEIVGLDRQACGGTHLASTGRSSPVRILKVDNKGRHNRRIRIGLVRSQ